MAALRQHETAGVGALPVPAAHVTRSVHHSETLRGGNVQDVAQLPGCDDLPDRPVERMESQNKPDLDDPVVLLRRCNDLPAIRRVQCHGLFQHDVLARFQTGDRHLTVERIGDRDDRRIEVAMGDQIVQIVKFRNIQPGSGSELVQPLRRGVAQRRDLCRCCVFCDGPDISVSTLSNPDQCNLTFCHTKDSCVFLIVLAYIITGSEYVNMRKRKKRKKIRKKEGRQQSRGAAPRGGATKVASTAQQLFPAGRSAAGKSCSLPLRAGGAAPRAACRPLTVLQSFRSIPIHLATVPPMMSLKISSGTPARSMMRV